MSSDALYDHLETGLTTVCRCWAVLRRDGTAFGFTDHDCDLTFDGILFRADTGLTARAIEQSTGLSVDNTEALGALSSLSISEPDIMVGRFDGAAVTAWIVNWSDVTERVVQFSGTIGEITRTGPAFTAELRGLAELLNQPQGRVYQKPCSAVLGDKSCAFDSLQPGYFVELPLETISSRKLFAFSDLTQFDDRWFERGRLTVISGDAKGLRGLIKNDRLRAGSRTIELWEDVGLALSPGDIVRLEAGCDKRPETCRLKFNNFRNFRGFPHIPGDDWLMSVPQRDGVNDGGSLGA